MEIIIKGEAKEIAGLVLAAQNQRTETERDALLRWYEFNLEIAPISGIAKEHP